MLAMSNKYRWLPPVLLVLCCLSESPPADAQSLGNRQNQRRAEDRARGAIFGSDEEKDAARTSALSTLQEKEFQLQALEAPVDPDDYIVGPGDVFQLNVWTGDAAFLTLPVLPEGKLVIPTVGTLTVIGKTLRQVQEIVRSAAARKYVNAELSVDLVALKTFRVHITGQVARPGPYTAMGMHRISDLIQMADGLTDWAADQAIEVRHRDGSQALVDLQRYLSTGDLDANIYLQAGDIVFVPAIDLARPTVRIEGLVDDPGVYQLQEGETVLKFLMRVQALSRRVDWRGAYIERAATANDPPEVIAFYPYLDGQGNGHSDLVLQDGDVIMIPQRQEEVYVIGAVRNPGPYPYYPNQQALEYVGFAGGHERAASLSKIKVIRGKGDEKLKGTEILVQPGDTVFLPERTEFGVREWLQVVLTVTNVLVAMKAVNIL